MFKIKRPAIIGLLLILLIFTGYLNYQFTQQALRKTSKQYQQHEALEKERYLNPDELAKEDEDAKEDENAKDDEDDEDDMEIVDSARPSEENIAKVVSSGNEAINEQIDQDVSNLNINYFVEHRLSRDKLRANLIDRLAGIVDNEQSNEVMRTEAQEEIMNIGKISEKELLIEGLVKSKGFEEVLVMLTNEDIRVVVSIDELTETEMVKILDIVKTETDFDMDNIKIMKKQ